jgi:hypothetical protein
VFVIVGLAAWHWTQALLGVRPDPAAKELMTAAGAVLTDGDALLELTRPINTYLNEHRGVANAMLIVSSAMIDVLGIFLLGWSVFGPSVRPFVGLLVLFGLRQVTQGLCALPPPAGLIWPKEGPGFPSLLVTYKVGNDFFFSGHTAIAVFGAIEVGRLIRGRLRGGAAWAGQAVLGLSALFLAAVVLLLRAHYTMDVLAGIMAAVLAAILANRIAPPCDAGLCRLVWGRKELVSPPSLSG